MSSLSPPSPFSLKVKWSSTGECRRVPLRPFPPLTFPDLLSLLSSLFSLPPLPSSSSLQLHFKDEEGELILLTSQEEWLNVQREVRERGEKVLVLHLSTAPSSTEGKKREEEKEVKEEEVKQEEAVKDASPPLPTAVEAPSSAVETSPVVEELPITGSSSMVGSEVERRRGSEGSNGDGREGLESSPVLVDGVGIPCVPDSHSVKALYRRHRYLTHHKEGPKEKLHRRRRGGREGEEGERKQRRQGGAEYPIASPIAVVAPSNSVMPSIALSSFSSSSSSSLCPVSVSGGSGVGAVSGVDGVVPSVFPRLSLSSSSSLLLSRLDRARAQFRSFLPFGRPSAAEAADETKEEKGESKERKGNSPSLSPSPLLTSQEVERRHRITSAFASLASFVRSEDEEVAELTQEEILNRSIALYTYSQRWLSQHNNTTTQKGAEEEEEEDRLHLLQLCEAQKGGLRSSARNEPPSPSLSPSLVTLLSLTQSHLRSRQVDGLTSDTGTVRSHPRTTTAKHSEGGEKGEGEGEGRAEAATPFLSGRNCSEGGGEAAL